MDGAEAKEPTRGASLVFQSKATLLKLRRGCENLTGNVTRWPQEEAEGAYVFAVAESRTPLWVEQRLAELPLQCGKVQNLRCALRRLNGTIIPARGTFSFWQQIGQATRGRGYVEGRQLQEGCLFPAIGGGLCQLSNALYAAALQAGCEIVERHPHTRIIPGSAAEEGRDATVAWNYIDLRFRAEQTLRIEARLSSDTLIVRFCSDRPLAKAVESPVSGPKASANFVSLATLMTGAAKPSVGAQAGALRSVLDVRAHSCHSCGMESCFRHRDLAAKPTAALPEGRTAFLLDEKTPEFAHYVEEAHRPADFLGIPLDGDRWNRPQYAWKQEGYAQVATATVETLARAFAARRLGRYGAARLQAQLDGAEALARRLARTLTPDVTHLCVSQALLPFLWRDGHLGGRTFDALMTRLPLETLHRRLEAAAEAHPERQRTLTEFRAPQWLVAAEAEALAAAKQIVTPHAEIAAQFPGRARRLTWDLPEARPALRGTAVAFPGPTAARKGAYELREVARACDLEIVLLGSELEGDDFWQGVRIRRVPRDLGQNWLEGVGVVVQPALIEDRPRLLLAALAAGVHVIATPACGLGDADNVTSVPFGETAALQAALQQALAATEVRREKERV